jgi:hypothetical protein
VLNPKHGVGDRSSSAKHPRPLKNSPTTGSLAFRPAISQSALSADLEFLLIQPVLSVDSLAAVNSALPLLPT